MFRTLTLIFCLLIFVITSAFLSENEGVVLRSLYSKPVNQWPSPTIDSGVNWAEFSPLKPLDSLYFDLMEQPKVKLGQLLFFDPLLSGSNQISCSSCHDPEISWADKRSVALGNDHLTGNRNTPSLLNVAARKSLFWDGRAATLEQQAEGPLTAHHEMNMKTSLLAKKLGKIKAYKALFKQAYGTDQITYPEILEALSEFQKTITSRTSRFDRFMEGEYQALNDQEIQGLHLFRTKARCMNCHNGKYLTDEDFHNIGLTYYKREYEDLGRYLITGKPEDTGKFRTPSLRDVMNTSPWMHNGLLDNMTGIINLYNTGMHMMNPSEKEAAADHLFPRTDKLLQPLKLTDQEIKAIVAFMNAVTATSYHMPRPKLPG
ncbi:cytochrome c peroxidase [Pedobacter cryoconitis]|uniref:Methylamine utilization protein MauG n=1 Tax=Pedobacter cryoconitis TaxID=188932 RepID=A0A7W8ZN18_9SPHI|nr:cytochrome c peroxidase [Pedobacter cryoconitis]MBB5636920.1 cytochrome c peroxidase [Pedobacter cryoconitis]